MTKGYGTTVPYSMMNQKPNFMINSVFFIRDSKNCELNNINIVKNGHYPFTNVSNSHLSIRDCYIYKIWNKGGGNRNYVQISDSYTIIENTVKRKYEDK